MREKLKDILSKNFVWVIGIVCACFMVHTAYGRLNTTTITVYLGEQTGEGAFAAYYMTEDDIAFSEDHVVGAFPEDDKAVFCLAGTRHNVTVRLDTDVEQQAVIRQINVKQGLFTTQKMSAEDLSDSITGVCSVDQNLSDEGVVLSVNGEDPNISFSLYGMAGSKIAFLLIILLTLICGAVSFVVAAAITYCFVKYTAVSLKVVKYASIAIAVGALLLSDYGMIKSVLARSTDSYNVIPKESGVIEISSGDYSVGFTAAGKEMLYLEANGSIGEGTTGTLSFDIEDADGKVIYSAKQQPLDAFMNVDMNCWHFDVNEAGLQHGAVYKLTAHYNISGYADADIDFSNGELLVTQYFNFGYKAFVISVIVIVSLIFLGLLVWFFFEGLTNRLFVATALVSGIVLALLLTPASRDDEYRHFIRAYAIANGQSAPQYYTYTGAEEGHIMVSVGTEFVGVEVPRELADIKLIDKSNNNNGTYFAETNSCFSINKIMSIFKSERTDETTVVSSVATAYRGALDYWPQIVGIWIGKLFRVRPVGLYFWARIGQVIICSLLGWLTLKLAPECKHIIWLSYFVPNIMLLRSSCSSDGIMLAEGLLFFGIIMHCRENKIKLFSLWIIPLIVILFAILKLKAPYAIMCAGMLLFLNKDNFRVKIKYVWMGIVAVAILVVCFILIRGNYASTLQMLSMGFLSQEHAEYIIANPGYIYGLFKAKMIDMLREMRLSLIGVSSISYLYVAVVSLLFSKREGGIWNKLWSVILVIGIDFIIVLAGYSMAPPDYGTVVGIGYRYMLPIVPLVAYILPFGNEKTDEEVSGIYPIYLLPVVCANILLTFVWSI